MPKKKFNPRTEPLIEKIKEFVDQIKEEYPDSNMQLQIFLSSEDTKAIQKYINWQHKSYTNKYKLGIISKFKDSGIPIQVMSGPEIPESKFMVVPIEQKQLRFPFASDKPQTYDEALENVRGLVDEAYAAMMPNSKGVNKNE